MTTSLDRRDFMIGVAAAGYGLLDGGKALAASGPDRSASPGLGPQPWAVWDAAEKPVRGGILKTAAGDYVGKMNPDHWPVLDWATINNFYDKLVITDGNYRPTINWLMQSLSYESPTVAVTKLRDGISFQDGTRLDAAAVRSVIEWIRDPKSEAWSASWLEPLDSVEVVDPLTLRWHFKTPWGAFAGIIANVPGYMISPAALAKGADATDAHPVGTGAYLLDAASPGNYVRVKRNPDWWFARESGHPEMPYFDGIDVAIIPDPAVRLANLRSGAIDILFALDKSQYAAIKDDPSLKVYTQPFNGTNALRFNCTRGVCKDVRVRKAISHAIDRQALIAGTQFGLARVASCLYPEDHWAHNPDLKPVSFDPGLAKSLLAEAGHPNGLTVRGFYNNSTAGQTVAEAIKDMLSQVNITWEVDLLSPVAATGRLKAADYDLAEGGWTIVFEPDLAATGLYMPGGGFNFGRSDNPRAIELIRAARSEVDGPKRQSLYRQLEQVLYDDHEDAWLWWEVSVAAMRGNLMGWDQKQIVTFKEAWTFSHPLWFKNGSRNSA